MSSRPHVHVVHREGNGVYDAYTADIHVFWPRGASYEDAEDVLMQAFMKVLDELDEWFPPPMDVEEPSFGYWEVGDY